MKISIIMPAYNEENTIEKNILDYCLYFDNNKENYEIIVSCNGCVDGTVKIVQKLSKPNKNVKCLEFLEKIGKGQAIIEGFKVAKGEIVGFVDADDAYNYNDVISLIDYIKSNNCDSVIASKWKNVNFKDAEGIFSRKIAGRIWNFIVRVLFNMNFRDTQGGAKFIKREVLENVIDKLKCNGFEFDAELLWRISQKHYMIKEVFVPSISHDDSSVTTRDYFSMFFNILKLRIGATNEQ